MLKRKYTYLFVLTSLALLLSLLGLGGCPTTEKFTLTTNISPAGAGSVSPSGGEYDSGVTVTLTATPATGYAFDYWSGSTAGTSPTTTLVMDSDKSVTAYFEATAPTPKVLFSDDFSRDTGVWDIFSDEDGSVFYENGWLHLINYTDAPVDTGTFAYQYFTDFILEVETKLIDGTDDNWHGVACRYKGDDNYYSLGISADGYYLIAKFVNGDQIPLAGPTLSSYINRGRDVINFIRIECIGSNLSLSVNGHALKRVTDTTFTGGDIALDATSWAGSFTEIAFDNIVVTEP